MLFRSLLDARLQPIPPQGKPTTATEGVLARGRHRFSETKLKKLPLLVRRALEARKTNLDSAWNFTTSPTVNIEEDSYYTLVNPATGESRRLTTPGEFAGTATGKNVVAPTKLVPLPKGAFVVYQVKTSGGDMALGVIEGSSPQISAAHAAKPTLATEGASMPGGVGERISLPSPEQSGLGAGAATTAKAAIESPTAPMERDIQAAPSAAQVGKATAPGPVSEFLTYSE